MDSMCEKILRSIENIIKNDLELEDFTIIPTDDNTRNKSPVLYEAHHLGLESWCTRYLYDYVCTKLIKVRKGLTEKRINLVKQDLNYLIMGALFINPDVNTFWNMRRELVEAGVFHYNQEFLFSKLVLTRKTKSNEAFAYRRWLLTRTLEKMSRNAVIPPQNLLESELALCSAASANTTNNYHAWTHRQWSISNLCCYFPETILSELEMSEKWIGEHVSENSGYHYRQFLIDKYQSWDNVPCLRTQYFDQVLEKLVLDDGERVGILEYLLGKPIKNKSLEDLSKYVNCVVLLLYELIFVINSIDKVYTEHESLWLHRRYVIYKLLAISHDYLGENFQKAKNLDGNTVRNKSNSNIISVVIRDIYGQKQAKIFKSQPNRFNCSMMYKILRETEGMFIHKNMYGTAVQSQLARRHEKWLQFVILFDLN